MSARDRFLLLNPDDEVDALDLDLDEDHYDTEADEDYNLDYHSRGADPLAWLGEPDEY